MVITHPTLDLAPITRHLRAMYSSRLLVAAVHHLPVFEILSANPQTLEELRKRIGLPERSAMVLLPALCAMGVLAWDPAGLFTLTEMGRYLTKTSAPNLLGYTGLEKDDPGVVEMARRLKNDGP